MEMLCSQKTLITSLSVSIGPFWLSAWPDFIDLPNVSSFSANGVFNCDYQNKRDPKTKGVFNCDYQNKQQNFRP